jgi:hypothetical protein
MGRFLSFLKNILFKRFFFPVQILSPSWSTLWLCHIPYLLPSDPHLQEDVLTSHPTKTLQSLGSPVSSELGSSSLTESRPSSPLLYMCWRPHISWCMLPGWRLSVWEIAGVQVSWDCWSSYRITLLLSFFQPFPISTTGVTSFYPLVGCKYVHLTLSAACWVFQRAVIIGPCL